MKITRRSLFAGVAAVFSAKKYAPSVTRQEHIAMDMESDGYWVWNGDRWIASPVQSVMIVPAWYQTNMKHTIVKVDGVDYKVIIL